MNLTIEYDLINGEDALTLLEKGKKLFVSGNVQGITKDKIKQIILDAGYLWTAQVGKIDLLIIGEKPSPRNLKQAVDANLPIANWTDLEQHFMKNALDQKSRHLKEEQDPILQKIQSSNYTKQLTEAGTYLKAKRLRH